MESADAVASRAAWRASSRTSMIRSSGPAGVRSGRGGVGGGVRGRSLVIKSVRVMRTLDAKLSGSCDVLESSSGDATAMHWVASALCRLREQMVGLSLDPGAQGRSAESVAGEGRGEFEEP